MRVKVEDVTDVRKVERVERDAQRRTDEDAAALRIRGARAIVGICARCGNLTDGSWSHTGDVCTPYIDRTDPPESGCDHAVTNPDCEHYS